MFDLQLLDETGIERARSTDLTQWRWQSAKGGKMPPSAMRTSHLFNTLRMIWNNTMPKEARVGYVKLYRFSSKSHPPYYLAEAAVVMFNELLTRKDLRPWMRDQLAQMERWFTMRIDGPPHSETRTEQRKIS